MHVFVSIYRHSGSRNHFVVNSGICVPRCESDRIRSEGYAALMLFPVLTSEKDQRCAPVWIWLLFLSNMHLTRINCFLVDLVEKTNLLFYGDWQNCRRFTAHFGLEKLFLPVLSGRTRHFQSFKIKPGWQRFLSLLSLHRNCNTEEQRWLPATTRKVRKIFC